MLSPGDWVGVAGVAVALAGLLVLGVVSGLRRLRQPTGGHRRVPTVRDDRGDRAGRATVPGGSGGVTP